MLALEACVWCFQRWAFPLMGAPACGAAQGGCVGWRRQRHRAPLPESSRNALLEMGSCASSGIFITHSWLSSWHTLFALWREVMCRRLLGTAWNTCTNLKVGSQACSCKDQKLSCRFYPHHLSVYHLKLKDRYLSYAWFPLSFAKNWFKGWFIIRTEHKW